MKNLFLARMLHHLSDSYVCGSWMRDLDGGVVLCSLVAGHEGDDHTARNGLRWYTDRSGILHVVHSAGQKKAGEQIAYRIRAELVCCDIYDRAQGRHEMLRETQESGHDLCYWGEASARLAEGYDRHPEKYEHPETFYGS